MKKSTLISTLAMVVIVALALTTATFAWYSSNSSVTANTKATAAVASAADLQISTTSGTAGYSSTVDLGTDGSLGDFLPLSVNSNEKLTTGTQYTSDDINALLHGQYVTGTGSNVVFKSGDAYTGGKYVGSLWVKNNSKEAGKQVEVKMSVTVTSDSTAIKNGLRIAVFKFDEGTTKYELINVVGETAYSYTDAFSNVAAAEDETTGTLPGILPTEASVAPGTDCVTIGNVASNAYVELRLLVWFDGEEVTADEATKEVSIALEFKGGAPTAVTTPDP